jgi:hypothetical protein
MKAVVIATTPDGSSKCSQLLSSLSSYTTHQILVLSDYSWELGKIKFITKHTDIEEFVFLHDSCRVKDPSFLDEVFLYPYSVAFSNHPCLFGMYLGKYQRSVLKTMDIPVIHTKKEAVDQEILFAHDYTSRDPATILWFDDFSTSDVFEQFAGKQCMKVENQYLIKWKSTWSYDQIA